MIHIYIYIYIYTTPDAVGLPSFHADHFAVPQSHYSIRYCIMVYYKYNVCIILCISII